MDAMEEDQPFELEVRYIASAGEHKNLHIITNGAYGTAGICRQLCQPCPGGSLVIYRQIKTGHCLWRRRFAAGFGGAESGTSQKEKIA